MLLFQTVCCYSKHCCWLGKITESWFTLVPNYSLRVWKLFNSNYQWDPSLLWAVKCAINLPSCLLLQLAASFIPYLSFITDIFILTLLKTYRLSGGQMVQGPATCYLPKQNITDFVFNGSLSVPESQMGGRKISYT